ncbi:Alpha-2-HS-glycoprotein [Nibea albiflora]|uniref:Alpha-2-HS-glycoprotein n=1 Tax=Nibea albiflora TaxID=240163 RepID=A0ACB7ELY3_NIBAL|nr:Alpha-2-HS-glycoprotein [Nibea albiflora]
MKALPILVVLSSVAQLCSAAPDVELLTCSEDNAAAAAHLAMNHINTHHHHGYKFRLSEIQGNETEKLDEGCNIELQLDLLETVCHTVNPKPFEDCELRSTHERAVKANCTVMISVENSDAKVTEYDCDTRQADLVCQGPVPCLTTICCSQACVSLTLLPLALMRRSLYASVIIMEDILILLALLALLGMLMVKVTMIVKNMAMTMIIIMGHILILLGTQTEEDPLPMLTVKDVAMTMIMVTVKDMALTIIMSMVKYMVMIMVTVKDMVMVKDTLPMVTAMEY